MIKNKLWYSELVLNELQAGLRNRDEKVDQREVILRMDAIVNQLAKEGFLENWKLGMYGGNDELFLTRFEWLTVTDPANNAPSYVQLPTNWTSLPKNMGLDQVYFKNDFTAVTKKYFDPVIVMSFKDFSTYRSNMAGRLEGRLGCYPKNGNLVFTKGGINAVYGQIGLALLVRDSSTLGDTDLYPIPANMEQTVIEACVNWFRVRLSGPADLIRDDNLKS